MGAILLQAPRGGTRVGPPFFLLAMRWRFSTLASSCRLDNTESYVLVALRNETIAHRPHTGLET